jgi:uncharacterized protein (TIGR03437 family)
LVVLCDTIEIQGPAFVPTAPGGSCMVFNDVALPLAQTSSGQISAQIPDA